LEVFEGCENLKLSGKVAMCTIYKQRICLYLTIFKHYFFSHG